MLSHSYSSSIAWPYSRYCYLALSRRRHPPGMIAPLTPLRFRYAVWLQSESDVCPSDDTDGCGAQRGGTYYACAIQARKRNSTNTRGARASGPERSGVGVGVGVKQHGAVSRR